MVNSILTIKGTTFNNVFARSILIVNVNITLDKINILNGTALAIVHGHSAGEVEACAVNCDALVDSNAFVNIIKEGDGLTCSRICDCIREGLISLSTDHSYVFCFHNGYIFTVFVLNFVAFFYNNLNLVRSS